VPRLVLAPHPREDGRCDAFWLVDGRVADWGPLASPAEAWPRTEQALRRWRPGTATFVPPDEVEEVRLVTTWTAAHQPPAMRLDGRGRAAVERFVGRHLAAS
jgi:hypothetical protein